MCSSLPELVEALRELGRPPVGAAELAEFLVAMARLLELAQVGYVEGIAWFDATGGAKAGGCASTAEWLSAKAGRSRRQAGADTRTVRLLHGDADRPLFATHEALATGAISLDQASTIAAALHPLPPETVQRVEATLVAAVVAADPAATGALCAHAAELASPDDAAGRAKVAAHRRHFDLLPDGDTVALRGRLSAADGELLAAALAPLAMPRPGGADGELPDERSAGQRRADAVVELARRAVQGEQSSGSGRPQVSLTIDLRDLATSPGQPSKPGRSATGRPVPAWEARMQCCDADVTAFVTKAKGARPRPGMNPDPEHEWWRCEPDPGFDPNGEPKPADPALLRRLLDQISHALGGTTVDVLVAGTTVRTIPPALRRAITLRDRGCTFPGCDRPPSWCDVHHNTRHWVDGGTTTLATCVLLCRQHHTVLHQNNQMLAHGMDGNWSLAPYQPHGPIRPGWQPERARAG